MTTHYQTHKGDNMEEVKKVLNSRISEYESKKNEPL